MTRLKKDSVHYLAFEGGGGRGVTYLGAIRELEAQEILPADKPISSRIQGISGASAGAITALVLAMGYKASDIEKLLNDGRKFVEFFDIPRNGYYRAVDFQSQPYCRTDAPSNPDSLIRARQQSLRTGPLKWTLGIPSSWYIQALLKVLGEDYADPINALGKDINGYIYNLLFDRGLFFGRRVREFFANLINTGLENKLKGAKLSGQGGLIGFQKFYELTGVDLVITGTNITQHEPRLFSRRETKDFPVAEAVALSMNLPILFKPIWVDYPLTHQGFYVDGGLLNNLPIHAFDKAAGALNSQILGLRLTEGVKGKFKLPGKSLGVDPFGSGEATVFNFLSDLGTTTMYPSEEGQLRTQQERDQTIELFTQSLTMTDFAPIKAKSETPINDATMAVRSYFG